MSDHVTPLEPQLSVRPHGGPGTAHSHQPLEPLLSFRSYSGEQTVHSHDYAQVLFAWRGRMDIEVGTSSDFADNSCGLVIPPGVTTVTGDAAALAAVGS